VDEAAQCKCCAVLFFAVGATQKAALHGNNHYP